MRIYFYSINIDSYFYLWNRNVQRTMVTVANRNCTQSHGLIVTYIFELINWYKNETVNSCNTKTVHTQIRTICSSQRTIAKRRNTSIKIATPPKKSYANEKTNPIRKKASAIFRSRCSGNPQRHPSAILRFLCATLCAYRHFNNKNRRHASGNKSEKKVDASNTKPRAEINSYTTAGKPIFIMPLALSIIRRCVGTFSRCIVKL